MTVSVGLGGFYQALRIIIGRCSRVPTSAFFGRIGIATIRFTMFGEAVFEAVLAMVFARFSANCPYNGSFTNRKEVVISHFTRCHIGRARPVR